METYLARAEASRAAEIAETDSPFTIEIRFLGGLTTAQQDAFAGAADRWTRVIVGDLPDIEIDGDLIDDVLILAQGQAIDGVGHVLGQAGPTHARRAADGTWQQPCKGHMAFDTADLDQMEAEGTLLDVITHEMGHVLGIGSMWGLFGLVSPPPDDPDALTNPVFEGLAAMTEYGALLGGDPLPVPVENQGGGGTARVHWRESVFANELMTGFVGSAGNPLSRLTVASLQDLGYEVDLEAADLYSLPNLLTLAQSGALVAHTAPVNQGYMIPTVPIPVSAK
ncbi:leishmanolysin-related zinc metalloendopeptidase [Actinomadura roseirufa]|uniref:leishmanolysin-related zinc metalloendopeptidase n=1 Tax=Actinomadura roseirufa TaxID=2094049 RepID=UPI001040F7C1|nr:leishmanolysin-related zinc metalloendopeptidase [Actinomadura roseirufa]